MASQRSSISILITLALVLVIATITVLCQRESRRLAAEDPYKNFKSKCGSAQQISQRTGVCMKQVLELIEGRVDPVKSDADMQGHCNRFVNAERCIRGITKECLGGIHKTAVGAVATSTKRWKTSACRTAETRGRYKEPLKCAIKKGPEMSKVLQNMTALMQGVRDLPGAPEDKLIKMCCVLNVMDKELDTRYETECPASKPAIISIVHALTDDARNTLCVNPKCSGALDKVLKTKYKPPQSLFEPIAEILFQLSVD